MTRKCKTPRPLADILMVRHEELLNHLEERLRVKRTVPVENQADHIRDATEGEMIARMEGYNAALEDVMHAFKCYAGFSYAGPTRMDKGSDGTEYRSRSLFNRDEAEQQKHFYNTDVTKAPRFAEWRRMYYTNGIKE